MHIIGPFWRQKPTVTTTYATYAWCRLWLNEAGYVIAIEWDR
jgi:hypothetical protein